jgi:hypothetical protein
MTSFAALSVSLGDLRTGLLLAGVPGRVGAMRGNGLDVDGFIEREGSLPKVADVFAPVVTAARAQISEAFGRARLHSAYLYGSIPRGTAIPGRSDLDLLLALRDAPSPADRAAADAIEGTLGDSFEQISGAGVLLYSTRQLMQ